MACGACQKAKARRKAALEARRARERQKQAELQARRRAAQQAQKQTIQTQQEPVAVKAEETP